MPLPRRLLFAAPLALGHLILAGFGAVHRFPKPKGDMRPLVALYGTLTGADQGYGFFAPGLGSQLRARFDLIDGEGNKRTTELTLCCGHETNLRVSNLIGTFWKGKDAQVKRSIAASWAGKVLAMHPGAAKIGVRLETYELPPMKSYQEGKRPYWSPYYSAVFSTKRRRIAE